MLKFHCEVCERHQEVEIEPLQFDELNRGAWGDIICKECRLVIATFSSEQSGRLVFIPDQSRAAELPPQADIAEVEHGRRKVS